MSRLGLQPSRITAADQGRIEDDDGCWGSYYEQEPVVLAGCIREGKERMASLGVYNYLYMNQGQRVGSCK